jgi:hypothetical protein
MTTAKEGGKVVSLTHRPHLPPENPPGTHFCQRLSRPHGHSAIGKIMSIKNSNGTIWNFFYCKTCTYWSLRFTLLFLCTLVSCYAWYGFPMISLDKWGLGGSLGLPLDPCVCALCVVWLVVLIFFFIDVSYHLLLGYPASIVVPVSNNMSR